MKWTRGDLRRAGFIALKISGGKIVTIEYEYYVAYEEPASSL
jgi:major membrane immunogen (membrane-anchored lipoprotein)